ncbi:Hypothetical predicted protein [Paramuricea clavata]|uniref:Uncharacterized protein n=1 Tax=Paramuricea clavata TaxID=317549 RepID=A0A7D9D9J6_PARCT|nr:Hypothetical predicted protein [Paramuricea clavata]
MKEQQPLLTATKSSDILLAYPVAVVNVEGVKCVCVILDTGTGSSYASAALLNRLTNHKHHKEICRVEMMLGAVTREMELSTVNVLDLVDDKFKLNVSVMKVDMSELLNVDNPHYQQLIAKASDYLCMKTDQPSCVGKTAEPVTEKTKFGWTIIVKGTEIDYTVLLIAQSNQTDYVQLCRLDMLGLEDHPEHDQASVYIEFREQLLRNNEKGSLR